MRCLVHGSFMNDNYGDYLIFQITMNILKKYSNGRNIKFVVDNVDKSYIKYTNVDVVNIWLEIFRCNCAIMTGGGYYGEPNKILYKYFWNLRFLLVHAIPFCILALRSCPYIIVGLGVGPLSWKFSRCVARLILRNAKKIVVRDEESREYIYNVLNVSNNVEVYPDLVMGKEFDSFLTEKEWAKEQLYKNNRKNIAIHYTTKYVAANGIAIAFCDIKKFLDEHKDEYNVFFILDQDNVVQEKRAINLLEKLGVGFNARIIFYPGPYKLTSFLSFMDIIITDKLHVGIVGTRLNKVVISTAGHQKIRRFYKQIGRSNFMKDLHFIKAGWLYNLLHDIPNQKDISDYIILSSTQENIIKGFIEMQNEGEIKF